MAGVMSSCIYSMSKTYVSSIAEEVTVRVEMLEYVRRSHQKNKNSRVQRRAILTCWATNGNFVWNVEMATIG